MIESLYSSDQTRWHYVIRCHHLFQNSFSLTSLGHLKMSFRLDWLRAVVDIIIITAMADIITKSSFVTLTDSLALFKRMTIASLEIQ
jgi:hypothetical protein